MPVEYYDCYPPRRMQPGTKLVLGLMAVFLGCLVLGGLMAVANRPHDAETSRPAQPAQTSPVHTPSVKTAGSDPWPECAAIREWFRSHAADPASIEIVQWEKRFPNSYDGPSGVTIQVRYRGKNQFGALAIERHFFAFRDGQLVRGYPQRDY